MITATDAIEMDRLEERIDEWPEQRIQGELEEHERARAVAGPEEEWDPEPAQLREGETRDDDNVHDLRNERQMTMADGSGEDLPELRIGDTVTDREAVEKTKMLVTGLPLEAADEITAKGKTIAEQNPSYPPDDEVVKIKYPRRTDVELGPLQAFAFPRSRLKLEHRFHGEDGGE